MSHHGVFAVAKKGFDLEVLFDPLKEQFDLPTVFVNGGDGRGSKVKVVGNKYISLTRLSIAIGNTSKWRERLSFRFQPCEFNRLVARNTG